MDPRVIFTGDVVDHTGKRLFPKGTSFNPADYLSLGRYIIIDGRSEKQVEFALQGHFRKIILISGDLAELTARYHRKFYLANDAIIDRLKIVGVPAIIDQGGGLIRVFEKAM